MLEVPKDLLANLKFRRILNRLGGTDAEAAACIRELCRRDCLFFINAFIWTFDPRLKGRGRSKWNPFICYPYQEAAVPKIIAAIENGGDLPIEKARDAGATILILAVFLWFFLFHDDYAFLLGSNKQESVDKTGNHKALFQKLDSMIQRLPLFLRYPVDLDDEACRTKNNLRNPATGGAFDGEATVANFGRGDRRSAVLMDEFAEWADGFKALTSIHDVTDCVIVNSTHQGSHTAFYDCTKRWADNLLRFEWWQHPRKAVGLYVDANGKKRSPWYDEQAKRRTPKALAQEIDIDVQGAAGQSFDAARVNELIKEAQHRFPLPVHCGELDFDPHHLVARSMRETADQTGRYRFWFRFGPTLKPPATHKYVIGGDVALGTGATNSVAAVWDRVTLERVADFHSNKVSPEQFAEILIVLSRMFNDSIVIWDVLGPGRATGKRLVSLGFSNMWFAVKNPDSAFPTQSDRPGAVLTPNFKTMIISEYARALYCRDCINWCPQALRECLEFVDSPNGPVHSKSIMRAGNPNQEGQFHGDFVIADCLAWHLLAKDARIPEATRVSAAETVRPNIATFAGRRAMWRQTQHEQEVF
jgi:hypothetical protein